MVSSVRRFEIPEGTRGMRLAWEAGLIMRPWGFMLEEIRTPTHLWHGEEDRNAPVAMGCDLARCIPGSAAPGVYPVRSSHRATKDLGLARIFFSNESIRPDI